MSPKIVCFVRHFDKCLLSIALCWLLASGSGFAVEAGDSPLHGALEGKIKKVEGYLETHKVESPALPDWEKETCKNLLPEQVPAARPFPSWVLHNRPNAILLFTKLKNPPSFPYEGPGDLQVTPSRKSMTLRWQELEERDVLFVDCYELLRSDSGKPFKVINKIQGRASQFVDHNVKQRTRYRYKVRSTVTLDEGHSKLRRLRIKFPKWKLTAEERVKETISLECRLIRTMFLVPLHVRLPGPLAGIAAKRTANLRVYLYSEGEWIFKDYWNIEEGQEIGSQIVRAGKKLDFRMGQLQKPRIYKVPHLTIKGYFTDAYQLEVKYPSGAVERYDSQTDIDSLKGS
jgi:hypothetical protein